MFRWLDKKWPFCVFYIQISFCIFLGKNEWNTFKKVLLFSLVPKTLLFCVWCHIQVLSALTFKKMDPQQRNQTYVGYDAGDLYKIFILKKCTLLYLSYFFLRAGRKLHANPLLTNTCPLILAPFRYSTLQAAIMINNYMDLFYEVNRLLYD